MAELDPPAVQRHDAPFERRIEIGEAVVVAANAGTYRKIEQGSAGPARKPPEPTTDQLP